MMISFIRTLILYCVVVFALRIMGKRQIGELSTTELVVTILASELASIPMQDVNLPLVAGIAPIFTLISIEILISFFCLKNLTLRKIVNGNPCIIVKDGKFDRKKMFEMRLTVDEVIEELRNLDVTDVTEVKYAIVETNGKLSVILYDDAKPLTASDLGIKKEKTGLPLTIINDGQIIEKNLSVRGKDLAWIESILKKYNIGNIKEVFVLTLDDYDNIFLQTRGSAS